MNAKSLQNTQIKEDPLAKAFGMHGTTAHAFLDDVT